ncbi:MAG: hypothetical protein ACT4UQ_06330 [Gammaproteobacteria bacterium]
MSEIKLSGGDGRAERGGGEPTPRGPRRAPVSRHGAISRELTKYASYKSWAEKVRGAFAADDGESGDQNGANGHNGRR